MKPLKLLSVLLLSLVFYEAPALAQKKCIKDNKKCGTVWKADGSCCNKQSACMYVAEHKNSFCKPKNFCIKTGDKCGANVLNQLTTHARRCCDPRATCTPGLNRGSAETRCRIVLGVGQKCQTFGRTNVCGSNTRCCKGRCAKPGVAGEYCGLGCPCARRFVCSPTFQCKPRKPGTRCGFGYRACPEKHYCVKDTCQKKKKKNESCNAPRECLSKKCKKKRCE